MSSTASRANRAMHPRSLGIQLVLLAAIELGLLAVDGRLDGALGWSTTFPIAVTAAALILLIALLLTGGPWPRYPVVVVLALHAAGLAFVALVGRSASGGGPWGVAAVVMGALYIAALALWFRARRHEADAGMPPGVGLTGAAVLRPQLDPRRSPLASEERTGATAPTVLLLHGLGATMAFWRPVARQLDALGIPSLTPDLLGFGASIRLGTRFDISDQAAAVIRLITAKGGGAVLIAAHSYGTAVAAQIAIDRPDLVSGLVLVEPAAFADATEARRRLGARSWLSRMTVNGSRSADWACGVMCLLRIPLGAIAPRLAKHYAHSVPADVARGAVAFVWPAYRDALASLLHLNPLAGWLALPPLPTTVIVGAEDRTVPPESIRGLVGPDVRFVQVSGSHALPLEHPDVVAALIAEARSASLRDAG